MTDYNSFFDNLETVNACLQKKSELLNSGRVAEIKTQIVTAEKSLKQELGSELNTLKKAIEAASDKQIRKIQQEQEKDNFEDFDPTFYSPLARDNSGKVHPLTKITNDITDIFIGMGFDVASGPLVETQEYNFTLLNMPDYHPARGMQDTFYLKQKDGKNENYVLRTHTSPVQIRYAKQHQPPFKMVAPGQVYRNENPDKTHDIIFHQIECLIVDKVVTIAHLKTIVEQFFQQFFEVESLQTRLRPSYFPYTIPSLEFDFANPFKPVKEDGEVEWLELGGSGLVHPQVIANIGLDPNQWQGLAFGFGIERMAQLKLGVSNLGQFYDGSIEFLQGRDF